MINIFQYLDYRKFLKDLFDEKKKEKSTFSHRSFSKLAGFASTNYILLVMQGKRNLSSDGVIKIAKALKLKKIETVFLENLVRFNQSHSDEERNFYYSRIASNKLYAKAKPLEKGQFEYYSNWYLPVIREMVLLSDFNEDPEWIATHLNPQITHREAEGALKLLIDIGLLKRDKTGKLVQEDRHITSGDDVRCLAISNFQREMIMRSAACIEENENKREVGSITFAASKGKLAEAKNMIREFRSKLAGFLAEDSGADTVYQFNFQLFGLTGKGEKGIKNE